MRLLIEKSFKKDLKKIKNKDILQRVLFTIEELARIEKPADFSGDLRKLRGGRNFWRIRIGDFRIGLEIKGETVILVRILHRKEIYKYFP